MAMMMAMIEPAVGKLNTIAGAEEAAQSKPEKHDKGSGSKILSV